MFHVKHRLALVVLLCFLGLTAAGCISAASPRGWAAPTQYNDLVLLTDSRGKMDAIKTSNGERQWRFPDDWTIGDKSAQKTQGIYSTPLISGNRAYLGDYNGYVYALDLATSPTRDASGKVQQKGTVAWARKPGKAIVGGLALDPDTGKLFATSEDGFVYAINTKDDKAPFERFLKTNNHIWSAPAISGGRVYVSSTDGKLYASDHLTAQEVWPAFKASAALVTTPTVNGDVILVGSFDSNLYAVSAATGQQIWVFKASNWVWAQPFVDAGTVYFGDFDGNVYALKLADGKPKWGLPFRAKDSIRAAPVIAGGTLVVASHDGHLYGLDPQTGASRWESLDVGAKLNADLARSSQAGDASSVLLAPESCASQTQSTSKLYYYGLAVSATAGTLQSTDKIC